MNPRKRILRRIGIAVLLLFAVAWFTLRIRPLPTIPDYSRAVYDRNGTLLSAYLSPDDKWRMASTLDEISPDFINAITYKEDRWFRYHPGFNPFSLARALYVNLTDKRRLGASTITMQVARMLEPKERSYKNKLKEILRAMQLEVHLNKEEILALYINLLPYGGNIEGVKAASYLYFNRPPSRLSLAQATALAIIPNDPNKYRIDHSTADLLIQRNYWLGLMREDELYGDDILDQAEAELLEANRFSMPRLAPHWSYYTSLIYPEASIHSSLDLGVQKDAELLLSQHMERIMPKGVNNGAILILDNATREIIAWAGSADFYDASIDGQVDGVRAVRSPGSTLKPLLYTLAFDMGFLTPMVKLKDVPTVISGYQPRNFDLQFRGEVTAKNALLQSLNIPAVRLLMDVGMERMTSALSKARFETVRAMDGMMGLSLILGGTGTTLLELCSLYSAFANGGDWTNPVFLKDGESGTHESLFSPEAAFLTLEILSDNDRPDIPTNLLEYSKLPRIAWKTGTSFGKRDAWAIGVSTEYTIGVWIGNFDGEGVPDLSGRTMAVPLLFDLFNSIGYDPEMPWFVQPSNVRKRNICMHSGYVPTANCEHQIKDYYITDKSHQSPCPRVESYYVDSLGKYSYCTSCVPNNAEKISYHQTDAEVLHWYMQQRGEVFLPPPHNPDCEGFFSDAGPKILSPHPDFTYFIDQNQGSRILLEAAGFATGTKIFWYANGRFLGNSEPGKRMFFQPDPGLQKITCMDDMGRSSEVEIEVRVF